MKKKYIIIGASAAAMGAIHKFRQLDVESEIICITSENTLPYNKCFLADLLSANKQAEQIRILSESQKIEKKIQLLLNTTVTKIDPHQKIVIANDQLIDYDSLLIATGSSVFVPLFVQKASLKGVFTFHTLEDTQDILAHIKTHTVKHVVIVGAGLSGLECADALMSRASITIIEMKNHVLPSLIDEQSAAFIQKRMYQNKIQFINNEKVVELKGVNGFVNRVVLESGKTIECDLLILTTGMVPNSTIAQNAQVRCEKSAIIVDQYMQTSKKDIYAAGDVILVKDLISNRMIPSCTWPDAMLQGAHAAMNMTCNAKSYQGVNLILNSSFFGLKFSTTLTHLMPYQAHVTIEHNQFKKIQIENNIIMGFTLIGENNSLFASLKRAIITKDPQAPFNN